MAFTLRRLYTPLIFYIIINEITGIYSDETIPDENRQSGARGRIIKLFSGTRPEPILCTGEGFLADPYNCATFYRCIKSGNDKYNVFRFQCGPGTIYDTDKNVCNYPKHTKRSECGDISQPFIHTTHINEIQDHIYNEIPSPMVSSKPISPSTTIQKSTTINVQTTPLPFVINSNKKHETTSTPATPYPWQSSINPMNMDYNLHEMIEKPLSTVSTIPHLISRGDICTSDGFIGDSENCRKFYRCVANQKGGFTRYEFTCSETTVWDDANQSCNHVWAVKRSKCNVQRDKVTNSHIPIITETLQTSKKNRTKPHVGENLVTNTVPQQQNNQTHFNYGELEHSNKINGSKQNQTQLSHESAHSQSQVHIDYGNKGDQTQLQIDHSKEASQNQIQISESSTKIISTTVQHLDGYEVKKPESTKCTEVGFIGDSKDCRKFYRCIDNGGGGFKKFGFSCADGTAWDASIRSCNHIWAVKGCNLQEQSIESSPHTITTTRRYKTTQNYHTTMSNKHTISQATEQNEDNDNIGYGNFRPVDIIEPTSSSKTTTTIIHHPSDTECKSNGFVGDDNDCKIFYRCVENRSGSFTKHMFKCGEGTVWDPEIQSCNHAWAVAKCGGNASPDISTVERTTVKLTTYSPIYIQNTSPTHLTTIWSSDDENDNNNLPGYELSNNEIQTTITSSKKPSILNQVDRICKSSGYIGDKYDCAKFYRCVDNDRGGFIYYEYTCSEGTLWDDKISACNYASAVDRCGEITNKHKDENTSSENLLENTKNTTKSTSSLTTTTSTTESISVDDKCTQSGFIGDSTDCKRFYRCVDNGNGSYIKHEFLCGEGTLWDEEIKSCNHAWAVTKCGSNGETSSFNEDHKYPAIGNIDSEMTSMTTAFSTSTEQQATTMQQNECVGSGFFGDTKHCEKFYRCVDNGKGGFIRYEYICGEGTVWDQSLKACNHRWAVKECCNTENCTVTKPSESTTEYSAISTTSLDDEESCVTQNASDIKCSKNDSIICNKEGFIADPHNCKSFYRCVKANKGGLTKYQYNCGEGTYWNQKILSCDHITANKTCGSEHISTTELPHMYDEIITETTTISRDENNPQKPTPKPSSTPTCKSDGFHSDQYDCKKFYRCVNNGKGGYAIYEFNCGEGTSWDQEIQACNHESLSKCVNLTSGSPQTTETQSQFESTQTQKTTTTLQSVTPSSTTTTTSSTSQKPITNSDSLDSPDSDLQNTDTCTSEGYFGNTQDCKMFYRCVNDGNGNYVKYDFICAEGTIWDKDVPICNHPENVVSPSCNHTQGISNIETLSSSDSTTSTTDRNQDQTETSNKPENNNINCTKAGFYADPNDCKKFYRCVDWDGNNTKFSIYHFECGEGTIWDPAIETCNHEDSVFPPRDCSFSQSTVTEGTTTTEKQSTSSSVTESTTQSTTKSTTPSTTKLTTEFTTTESVVLTTTKRSEETTTEQSVESTTEYTGETTTQDSGESTTKDLGETTTDHVEETTTENFGKTTTEHSGETTTEYSRETTTTQSEENTTPQLGESTTEQLGVSTTEQSVESTTEQTGQSTTEKSVESTTEEFINNTTTEGLGTDSTTGVSTTEQSGQSTTEKSVESTTEEFIDNTTTEGLGTDSTTTDKYGTTESETDTSTEKPTGGDCPKLENDQNLFVCPSSFKRHPKYCNLFYQCDENEDTHDLKIAVFTCPNNTIYDENKTKCVNENKAEESCQGEILQNRRVKRKNKIGHNVKDPLIVSEKSYGCSTTGYFAFEKEGDCSAGFLKCTSTKSNKLRGLVYQCPAGYLFWNVSRRCEPMNKISDCKHSLVNDWGRRWEIPVERTNVAW